MQEAKIRRIVLPGQPGQGVISYLKNNRKQKGVGAWGSSGRVPNKHEVLSSTSKTVLPNPKKKNQDSRFLK
jgi:hypothetical protein